MTTDKTPAEIRAEARAAKAAASLAATAAHYEAVASAAAKIADWRAGVTGAKLADAMRAAAVAAALIPDLPVRASKIMEISYVCTEDAAVMLSSDTDWCRQGGVFLRSGAELREGSFAVGVARKPRRTAAHYCLGIVEGRACRLIWGARTASEDASAQAASTLAEVWAAVVAAADAIEASET